MALTKAERREAWKERTTATATSLREAGATISTTGVRSVPLSGPTITTRHGTVSSQPIATPPTITTRHGETFSQPIGTHVTTAPRFTSPSIQQRIVTAPILSRFVKAGAYVGGWASAAGQKFAERRPAAAKAIYTPFEEFAAGTRYGAGEDADVPSVKPTEKFITRPVTEWAVEKGADYRRFIESHRDPIEQIIGHGMAVGGPPGRQPMYAQTLGKTGVGVAQMPAGFLEMGGLAPFGIEYGYKHPKETAMILPVAAGAMIGGTVRSFRERPWETGGEFGAMLLGPKVAGGVVRGVSSRVPYRVGLGTPKDLIIKASDVYVPKQIKTPLDIPVRPSATKPYTGRLYDAYGLKIEAPKTPATITKTTPVDFIHSRSLEVIKPGDPYHSTWRTPVKEVPKGPEYFISELRKPTEYGGTADIYMKVSKAQEQALAKSIAARYEVELGTARFGGKSHQVIEPTSLRTPKTHMTPSGSVRKIPAETEAIRIGDAGKYHRIIGGKKLSDYVRLERKLNLEKIDITMKDTGPPKKLLTDFPESKIVDTTIVTDISPKIKPMGVAVEPRYTESSLSRFMLDTRGTVGFQQRTPIIDQHGMPVMERQRMPIMEQVPRTKVMERTDYVRQDLLNLKVKPAESALLWDDYNIAWDKKDKTIGYVRRPTIHKAKWKEKDVAFFPIYSGKQEDDSIRPAPIPSALSVPSPYPEIYPEPSPSPYPEIYPEPSPSPYPEIYPEPSPSPYPETHPDPHPKQYPDPYIKPSPEPTPRPFEFPIFPPPPVPTTTEFETPTIEPEKKRKEEYELLSKKQKPHHPWFPASLEYVNLEESMTGKRAIHIKPRKTTQKLFKGLITTGKGIQTKAQYEKKLPTKFM